MVHATVIEHSDIQLARPTDAGQIARMSRDLIEAGLGWSWTGGRVAGTIRDPACNVAVVRDGRVLRAFGIMQYELDTAHLVLFAVRPNVRRRGVGSGVLGWLETTAVIAGVQTIDLETRLSNDGARRFYVRHGYRELDRIPGYYNGRETAVRMQKTLRPAAPV